MISSLNATGTELVTLEFDGKANWKLKLDSNGTFTEYLNGSWNKAKHKWITNSGYIVLIGQKWHMVWHADEMQVVMHETRNDKSYFITLKPHTSIEEARLSVQIAINLLDPKHPVGKKKIIALRKALVLKTAKEINDAHEKVYR